MTRPEWLDYVELEFVCHDEVCGSFGLGPERGETIRPWVTVSVGHVLETGPNADEAADAELVHAGPDVYLLASPAPVGTKLHIYCLTCQQDQQLTEGRLLELLALIRRAWDAGEGPQKVSLPLRRVGNLG